MTYLQLCQRLRQEAELPGTGPSSVTGQTGQFKRLVDWIAASWRDIQNYHPDWRWMRRPFSFNTVAGTDQYASGDVTDVDATGPITRFARWWWEDAEDPPLAYLQSAGVAQQYRLIALPWEHWKWLYRFGAQTNQPPIHVSVDPQNRLCLGPKPDAVYVVTGEFQRSPQELTIDADTPEMPVQYHDLIWAWGLEKYAANAVAAELVARAQLESTRLMSRLEHNQRPAMSLGGPLA